MTTLDDVLAHWDGESVVCRHDRDTDAWMFVALHSTRLGPPLGGTRMRTYAAPGDACREAMRLAEGMTAKWAVLGQPFGGGKAVLAVPEGLDGEARTGLLRRYGRLVESLRGAFSTGEDLGTTPDDMGILAEETRWVHGREDDGSMADPGPYTARAVFLGIEQAVRVGLGTDGLRDVHVLVQGVGDVGAPLCHELHRAGARLAVSDPDSERVARIVEETGAEVVAPGEAIGFECDVFAPCAIGRGLSADSIPRLRCRVVAGSANDQLDTVGDADRMHDRGILWAPDFAINAGGALAFALHSQGEKDPDALYGHMDDVGRIVGEILDEARERGEGPLPAARARVDRALTAQA